MRYTIFFLSTTLLVLSGCSKSPESAAPPPQLQDAHAADPPTVGRYTKMDDPLVKEYIIADVLSAEPTAMWRWTGKNPTFRFKLRKLENLRFHADFTVNNTALKATGPVTITWFVNDHELAKETHTTEGFKKIEKPVPAEWLKANGENIVSATIDKLYNSPDGEKYGFIISNLGFID